MRILFQLFILFLLSIPLKAQSFKFSKHFDSEDSTQIHILETYRGDIFRGKVVATEKGILSFITEEYVAINFELFEIRNVFVEGKDRIKTNKARQKLKSIPPQMIIFSQTAFPIPKGVRIYQNIDLWWNSFDVGLSDNFSMGVATLLPFFIDVRGKYSYKVNKLLHVGLDINMVNLLFFSNAEYEVHAFFNGTATIGKPKLYMNLSLGVFKTLFFYETEYKKTAAMTGGLGFGGEVNRFIFKSELTLFATPYQAKNEIIWPSVAIGWKSIDNMKRYNLGFIRFPGGYVYLPYLSFRTSF